MKIIFSYISNRKCNGYNKQYLEIAAFANYLVKKHYPHFETIFCGDKESIQTYSNISYDRFIEVSKKEFKDIPSFLWSLGKYITILKFNEPFLHLDLDVLLFRPLKEEVFNKDIVCFHNEHFSNHLMEQMQNIVQIRPQESIPFPTISYNCAMFGGKDIQTIKKSINSLLTYVKENTEQLKEIYNSYHNRPNNQKVEYFDLSILAEQIWLFHYFKHYGKEIYEITEVCDIMQGYNCMMQETGYMHLIERRKDQFYNKIRDAVTKLNIKY